uniref:Chloride channel protein n=1 Tax=Heterorhabditis bacteriophora TaxID=37862 RepID=A0A1I7XUN1_HETBA
MNGSITIRGSRWIRDLSNASIKKSLLTGIDPGKYALAGAAAQLGGIVRMTISLTAIIMEATKDITFGLPIMLVLMLTKWVGDIFNEGLYDMHIDLQEVPILGWHPPKMSRNILASIVMRSDVVAMERRERVARVLDVLRSTSHHGFPVVDRIEESTSQSSLPDYGHLKGVILRSQLITLLEKRVRFNITIIIKLYIFYIFEIQVFYSELDGIEGMKNMGSVTLADFYDEDA